MLYDIGFAIFSIFYLPTLIFKGKLHGDFAERFANYAKAKRSALDAGKDTIWIQAVSVGEVALCRSFIPLLRKRFPKSSIVLSTITKTGNDLAVKLYSKDATIIYFPLDFSAVVKKAIAIIRPKAYVMIETEIWPNVLKELSRQGVPAVLINGRISDKSFGKYRMAKPFLQKTLQRISSFCMQSKNDADRVVEMGAPADKVRVTGNMKFDTEVKADPERLKELKKILGIRDEDRLIVAGSTHEGEEEIVIRVFKQLMNEFKYLKLLIAPRHIERADAVKAVAHDMNFVPFRVSGLPVQKEDAGPIVMILDKIGQLADCYALASFVFIGGSLVRHGGQNPIEPALLEKPIIFGPHMFNFKSSVNVLIENNAAIQVKDEAALLSAARDVLKSSVKCAELGRNAKEAMLKNRGATEKNLKEIGCVI